MTPTRLAASASSVEPPDPGGEEPGALSGPATVALVATILPFAVAVYAIADTGQHIAFGWKYALVCATAGVYGLALVAMGRWLARTPARVTVGLTMVVCAGILAAMIAGAGWVLFVRDEVSLSRLLILVNTVAATFLATLAAQAYAQITGRRFREMLPLVAAVLLLGLTGGRFRLGEIMYGLMIADAVATLAACAIFLRPRAERRSPSWIALALAVPLSGVVLRISYFPAPHEVGGFLVGLLFALRALRPLLHHGSLTLAATCLLAAALVPALPHAGSRPFLAAVALWAMLRLSQDVEGDPDVGALERRSPAWLASALWLLLAGTWAHDLRLIENWFGQPPGWHPPIFPWLGLLALPLAVPPFALAWQRRRAAPPIPDPELPAPGMTAETTGWLVVALAIGLTLYPTGADRQAPLTLVVVAVSAGGAGIWAWLRPSAARNIIAHLLLLGAAWLLAERDRSPWLDLLPALFALGLSVAPLARGSRVAGLLGLGLFPLITLVAVLRDGSVLGAAGLLSAFGLVQLLRPPLADIHFTRMIGTLSLGAAAWLLLAPEVARSPVVVALPSWSGAESIWLVAALCCAVAVPLFWLAGRQRQGAIPAVQGPPGSEPAPPELEPADPALVLEAVAWAFLAVAATLSLSLAQTQALGVRPVAVLVATTVVAGGWAWRRGSAPGFAGTQVLLLASLWAACRPSGGSLTALIPAAGALLLALAPWLPGLPARVGGWVGLALFPPALVEALLLGGASRPVAIGLLLPFGLVQLLRPPLARPWTRIVGPPALFLAGYLLLTGSSPSPALASHLPSVGALALLPLALWVAVAGGPLAIAIEILAVAGALLLVSWTPLALLPMAVLALGRSPAGRVAAPPALVAAGALLVMVAPSSASVSSAAAAMALGGLLLLGRFLIPELRTLGVFALAAAPLVLLFAPRAELGPWSGPEHLPLAAAAVVAGFAGLIAVRGRPSFLTAQVLVGVALVAIGGTLTAFAQPLGSGLAIEAGAAALLALAAALAISHRLTPETATAVWGFAALAAPLAIVPMSDNLWHGPVVLVGAVEVILLGLLARRRESPILAGCTLWLGLLVAVWGAATASARLLPAGGSVASLLSSAAIAAAVTGMVALLHAGRWLGAPPYFVAPFIHACMAVASIAGASSATFAPLGHPAEVVLTLLALVLTGGLSIGVAIGHRLGSPIYLAGATLVLAYVCLRARTDWVNGLRAWDGLVAVAAGLLLLLIEWRMRRAALDPEEPAVAIGTDEPGRFGPELRAVQLLGTLITSLAAVAFFEDRSAFFALGPLAGAALFFWRASRGGTSAYAVAAAALVNATVLVWLADQGVGTLGAYALPLGASSAALLHAYRHSHAVDEVVRSLPPLAVAGICLFDVMDAKTVAPALLLIGLGLGLLPMARLWRLRSHLWIGLGCLAAGGIALAQVLQGGHLGSLAGDLADGPALLVIPLLALVAALAAVLVVAWGQRLLPDLPPEILHARSRDCLAFAAMAAGAGAGIGPIDGPIEIGAHLLALAAVMALALRIGIRDRAGWPLLLAGGGAAVIYVYLRAHTGWLVGMGRWDPVAAVAAGCLLTVVERGLRRSGLEPAAELPLAEAIETWPFGAREARLMATAFTCLAAVAFLDLRGPLDTLGPLLAALFFLARGWSGNALDQGLAALFVSATLVLSLVELQVTVGSAYVIPVAAIATLLLQRHRMHLVYDEGLLRSLPPIAAAATCVYDAVHSPSVLLPTAILTGLGLTLLLLSRLWQVRAYLPLGLACVGAAMLATISDWNARGWTAAAVAMGTATLLFPALLLRRR